MKIYLAAKILAGTCALALLIMLYRSYLETGSPLGRDFQIVVAWMLSPLIFGLFMFPWHTPSRMSQHFERLKERATLYLVSMLATLSYSAFVLIHWHGTMNAFIYQVWTPIFFASTWVSTFTVIKLRKRPLSLS